MTASPRPALRLSLALGLAGLMVTGSAAMAWPVLKIALAPVAVAAQPVIPADPAAVSGFVDTTRAQAQTQVAKPALARSSDLMDPTLAHATDLMLDASILRQPRQPAVMSGALPAPVADPLPGLAAQAPLPAPRPVAPNQIAPREQVAQARIAPAQIAPAPQAARVVPASAPAPAPAAPASTTRERLMNMWVSGAYR